MDMRFLYLEQISDAVRTVDLEEQLATLLDPDFFCKFVFGTKLQSNSRGELFD